VTDEIISCDARDADHVIAAVDDRTGKTREGGSRILWVKDVDRFSAAQQAILLRLIGDMSRQAQPARIPRVIASSNVDLFDRVTGGSFDAQLFYLLNSIHIVEMPATGLPGRA
jgi:DNA-binding NtrC family response regulator